MPPSETPLGHSKPTLVVGGALAVWLITVFILGVRGVFPTPPGTVPVPIIIGITAPVIVFLAAFRLSRSFHNFVLAGDLRLIVGIQAWRFAGIGFLALYAQGALPGFFAWPAGLGDIAVGGAAPWVALALIRRPKFKESRVFLFWNLFGLPALIVAVTTGALSSGLAPGLTGAVTTAPMAHLPLVLIPVYFVPIFVMLHLATLFQVSAKLGNR